MTRSHKTYYQRARHGHSFQIKAGRMPATLLTRIGPALRSGAVAIFPTETVYGIGASAFSLSAIRRIYQLKGRTWNKPLALLVPALDAAAPLLEDIPPEAYRLAKAFWPGPMTLVLRASALGKLVTGGLETIGVRVPDHPIALALLKETGLPLATTSVNRSGQEPATSGVAAARLFGSRVDWVLDAGASKIKRASCVIDVSHYPFMIKRPGTIAKHDLEKILFH